MARMATDKMIHIRVERSALEPFGALMRIRALSVAFVKSMVSCIVSKKLNHGCHGWPRIK
jgi:hypothetical protein